LARILVVDDSAFARHRIQQLLEAGGHEVVGVAANGAEALRMYEELSPDLLTLDHVMDDTPGEAVLKRILDTDPDARVIMISGSNDASLEQRVLDAGARAFIEKFSTKVDLVNVVDQILGAQG
jgi:two-component system chemotaxis response regulator CheY